MMTFQVMPSSPGQRPKVPAASLRQETARQSKDLRAELQMLIESERVEKPKEDTTSKETFNLNAKPNSQKPKASIRKLKP